MKIVVIAKSYFLVFLIALIIFIPHLGQANGGKNIMAYRAKIKKIQGKVLDLTAPSDLFGSKEFNEISEDPKRYLEASLNLLSDVEITETEKQIVAFSMQSLPLNDFIYFCERIVELRIANKINQRIFGTAIFAGYDWNTKLQESFETPKVQNLLIKIRKSNLLPAKSDTEYDGEYIDEILTGKAALHIKDLRSAGQIPKGKNRQK